jgi:hypothetical protein
MSNEKRLRTLGKLTGVGIVYKDDQQIARVRYSLRVTQQIIILKSDSGIQEIPGLKDIKGVLTVLAGERRLANRSTMVLQLSDGHLWEFIAESGNFISGEYAVVGTGRQDFITS